MSRQIFTVVLVLASIGKIAPAQLTRVELFYQVRFLNGEIQNLTAVPEIKKNILKVTRIAAFADPRGMQEILSTETPFVNRNDFTRTTRAKLTWNGKAWVGDPAARLGQLESSTVKILTTESFSNDLDPVFLNQNSLTHLFNKLAFWRLAGIDIEADMFEFAGTPEAGRKRFDLAAVEVIQRDIINKIEQNRKVLEENGKQEKPVTIDTQKPILPSGKVTFPKPDSKWAVCIGVKAPIEKTYILPWQTQVWKMAHSTGARTYRITMAHPEAGTFSAFHYVAYADTNGDGLPNKMIARSPLAQSEYPGQWTTWSFTTKEPRVFIGNTWPHFDTTVYYQPATDGKNWKGFADNFNVFTNEIFASPPIHKFPTHMTNCRILISHASKK